MAWGTVQVGSVTLREALESAGESSGSGRTLDIKGQEAAPDYTVADVTQRHDDILGLVDDMVPVLFTDKPDRNGYYVVSGAKADMMNWQNELVTTDWTMSLDRAGTDAEVDIEARLSGAQTRQNSFSLTGDRWDAPPIGAYGYYAGASTPSVLTRTGEDGAVLVYRGLNANTNPRYGCAPADYMRGRVRIVDANGKIRAGTRFNPGTTAWTLSNGLVRVTPRTNGLSVDAYTGGAWRTKLWDLTGFGSLAGAPDAVSVLRNEPECVILRVLFTPTATGRVSADLTLRRGSRFVEVYLTSNTSTTLKLGLNTPATSAAGTGFISATANDANGNRYVLGSALTFTSDLTNGAISKASTTTLDAFIGVAAGGSSAVSGDAGADLMAQYLGACSATVKAVRR